MKLGDKYMGFILLFSLLLYVFEFLYNKKFEDAMGNQSSAAFSSGVKLVIYPALSQGQQTQASEHRVRLLQAI